MLALERMAKHNVAVAQGSFVFWQLFAPLIHNPFVEMKKEEAIAVPTQVVIEESIIEEEVVSEAETEEEVEEEKSLVHEDDLKQPQSVLFDDVFGGDFQEPDFVKVNDVPVEVEQVAQLTFEAVEASKPEIAEDLFEAKEEAVAEVKEEIVIEKVPEVVFEEPKTMSLNDRLTKGINIGLNDRIAFEKKLFGGSSDDFNRVLSQLNTFDSFDEAQGFINDFVKPDYNNWDGKEEFENRFLEIVEKKFN